MIAALTTDGVVMGAISGDFGTAGQVLHTRSWARLLWLVRERPVTATVVDSAFLGDRIPADELLMDLRRRFPSLGIVFVARPELQPLTILRVGRAGISDLAYSPLDDVRDGVQRGLRRGRATTTTGRVLQAVGDRVPAVGRFAIRRALDGALQNWRADDLASSCGWTRAHLSVRLAEQELPSTGHLLTWARMLHAGRWLTDPGRTAESISRQLEYANGATFRRALRNYTGLTPTQIRTEGGLDFVLRCFLDECGVRDSLRDGLSVA